MQFTTLSNKQKEKSQIISKDADKAFARSDLHSQYIKLSKLGLKGNFINLMKAIYEQTTANILLEDTRLTALLPRSGISQGCMLSPLLFNTVWRF